MILRDHYEKIEYSDKEWDLLRNKRVIARDLLSIFIIRGFHPYIYGSVARGNVNENSDIDIIFLQQIPSFQIEFLLHQRGFENFFREIIMATPKDSIKLYIHLSEMESITLPLSKMSKNLIDFYDFGGKVDLEDIKNEIRVPGIDKRLVYIKPNDKGHEEMSVIGNESIVAKEIGIPISIIKERKAVLLKREKFGKTGVFLKRNLNFNETTEEVLRSLAKSKSIIRKKLVKI
ncbi:MAG: nucleotidyltransferase domain-containing protein [Promethearchaeota archaeon]